MRRITGVYITLALAVAVTLILMFTSPNLQTRLAEYLRKPHGAWVKYVPDRLRGLIIRRSVTCEVSANAS